MIKIKNGNIFNSSANGFVNPVNCVGVMGAGLAKEFKIKFPDMFKKYKKDCMNGVYKPGRVYIWKYGVDNKFCVINFTTKNHWRNKSKYEYVVEGLDNFIEKYNEWGLSYVAFPLLGTGCGGLDEDIVMDIMKEKLGRKPISIEIWVK